jgi:hypothetical protein
MLITELLIVRDFKIKNIQLFIVGWASCPPYKLGGQDAHPTRLDNLFLEVTLLI